MLRLALCLFCAFTLLPAMAFAKSAPKPKPAMADTCAITFGTDKLKFAHCEKGRRDYRTAIIAIHGWNGSCKETFGEAEGSLFSVIGERRYYDWDCLDYESHGWTIKQNAVALGDRIEALKGDGYEHLMFITHSTGGIVLLEYLMGRIFEDDGKTVRPDAVSNIAALPKLTEATLWAAPINGVRWHIKFLGNFTGSDEKSLPQLSEGSPYLESLKARLVAFRAWYQTLPPKDRGLVATRIKYLQGDDQDWVVNSIDRDKAEATWLGPQELAEYVPTEMPHLDSVNDGGDPRAHKMPAIVTRYVALTSAPYDLRFEDVFLNTKIATDQRFKRQSEAISGLAFYATENFNLAIIPALKLLNVLMSNDFIRSAEVDEQLVDTLLDLLDQKFETPAFANAAVQLLNQFPQHNFQQKSTMKPGHGNARYVAKVLKLIDKIYQRARDYSFNWPGETQGGTSRDAVEIGTFNATLAILQQTKDDAVRDMALGQLANAFQTGSAPALLKANLAARLGEQYYAPRASLFGEKTKALISQSFAQAITRNDEVSAGAMTAINGTVRFAGKDVPLWQSLQSAPLVQVVQNFDINPGLNLNNAEPWRVTANQEWTRFNVNAARGVGLTGNQLNVAKSAIDNLNRVRGLDNLGVEITQFDSESPLNTYRGWPNVKAPYENLLRDMGG